MIINDNSDLSDLLHCYIVVNEMKNEEPFISNQFTNVLLQVRRSSVNKSLFVLMNENIGSIHNNKLLPSLPIEIVVIK